MTQSVKVLVSEIDGVELAFHQEYVLKLDNIIGLDLSSMQTGQQIAKGVTGWDIITPAGSSTITPEYTSSESTSSTSSKNWQTKLNYTTSSLPAGDYEIHYSSELYCNKDSKEIGWRMFVDGVEVAEQSDGVNEKKTYRTLSGFKVIPLTQGTHDILIEFNSPDKKLVRVRRTRVIIRSFV